MNKIIKKDVVLEESDSESLSDLRRLNSKLVHDDISEESLAHFGVLGMKWGVRKGSDGSSGSSIGAKIKNAYNKSPFDNKQVAKDWAANTKGMSNRKKAGLLIALGPYWGAKAAAKMQAKAADPKEIVKKETKALRKKIESDWAKRSDAEFAANEAEFKTKYGKQPLRDLLKKSGREEATKRADIYSQMLTKRMENVLNESAAKHLAGTNYKVTTVKGFNDFLPDFQVVPNTIEHSNIITHAAKSWKLITERDSDGFVKSIKFPEDFLNPKDDEFSFMDDEDEDDSELAHFGVRGMKWGIRKDSSGSQNRSARKQEKIKKKEERELNRAGLKAVGLANKKYLDIYNAMADESAGFYRKINNSEKYKKLDLIKKPNSKLAKEYYKECADTATASLQKHSDRILGNKIDSRLKVVFYQPEDFGSMPSFYVDRVDIQHSDNSTKIKLLVKFDKYGKLIKLDFPEDIFEIMNEDDTELTHFGVRGMKWGIRKDSTYSQNRSARKSRVSMYKKRRIVSDDDLKKMVSRLETEKKLKSLVEEDIAPGRTAARSQIAKFGTTALGAAAGYAGVVLIKRALEGSL